MANLVKKHSILTSKEFALLELFLLHAPDLVSRSEIVEARLGLSLQEWKQPCRRLYQSFAAEDRTEWLG
jgi:DNA-binding winged helix-turn-helix (wHTH) protein